MPEERSPLTEYRHLEEKLKTVGLSPAEQARHRQLAKIVSQQAPPSSLGFDVNAAADELKASLEPVRPRRSPRPEPEPAAPDFDAGEPALDPGSGALNQGPAGDAPGWDPAAAGSHDQAVWDAGAPLPPIDPAAAFDLNAPSFEAGAQPEVEPAALSYDLGPEAFDVAGLPPPDPGPGGYDGAAWDAPAAVEPPADAAEAGPQPEPEVVEAELIEAEPAPEGAQPPGGAGFEAADEAAWSGAPAPEPGAPAAEEVLVEELPSVEVDVEEVLEMPEEDAPPPVSIAAPPPRAAPPPPAVPPPRAAPPARFGGPSPSFVIGEHRVVIHTLEGQVLRGTIADTDLDSPAVPLVTAPGAATEPVPASRVKAIFFMLLPGGRPPAAEGRKVRVTFRDGRQVAGFSPDYDPEAVGFFMVPAESRTNTGRIWVYREAVKQVSVT